MLLIGDLNPSLHPQIRPGPAAEGVSLGLEFAPCRAHSISPATCRLDYGTNTSTLPSGGLGVALVPVTGEVPRVKWEVKRNMPEGSPRLSPCERNILPHRTAQGSFSFWMEAWHSVAESPLPSAHAFLCRVGSSCLSPASPVTPEAGPTCGQVGGSLLKLPVGWICHQPPGLLPSRFHF